MSVSQVSLSSVLEAIQGRKQSKVCVLCWNYSFLLRITGDLISLSLEHWPTSLQALFPDQKSIYETFSNHHLIENAQSLNHGPGKLPFSWKANPQPLIYTSCLFLSLLSGLVKHRFLTHRGRGSKKREVVPFFPV